MRFNHQKFNDIATEIILSALYEYAYTDGQVPVMSSEKEKTLTRHGCVFSGQELLDNHEIDPDKSCYCGRPNKRRTISHE